MAEILHSQSSMKEVDVLPLIKALRLKEDDTAIQVRLTAMVKAARQVAKFEAKTPTPRAHNEVLERIERAAQELRKAIGALRRPENVHVSYSYWMADVFGPEEEGFGPRADFILPIKALEEAAIVTRDNRRGRPRDNVKLTIVEIARRGFENYSHQAVSTTETGPFAEFARAFYEATTGRSPDDDGGIDRQIRAVISGRK